MGLFHFIKENYGIRFSSDRFCQLAALFIAHISGRCPDQTGHAEFFHIFRHIDTNHVLFIVKQTFRQGLGQLRLAYARRPQEQERTDGPVGALNTRTAAQDGFGNLRHRFLLTNYPFVQDVFHVKQLVPFPFHQLGNRNTRPAFDDAGNFFLRHLISQEHIFATVFLRKAFLFLQFLLKLGQLAVFQFRRLVQVIFPLRRLNFRIHILNFFPQLLHDANGVLFILPFCLQRRKIIPHLRQFSLDFLQMLSGKLVVLFFQSRFFDFMLDDLSLDDIQFHGHGVHFCADHGAGFIHQVDGLIGQETVGNISVGQSRRRNDGLILNFYTVVNFISFLQATQDGNGILHRWFADQNRLETAFQSGVFFHILSVFIQGCRTDAVQFPPCQHRLQKVPCVHGAVCFACPHNGMQFIDEKNDFPFAFLHFVEDCLQPFFKFPAKFRPGNEGPHIQRENRLVLQAVGHILFHDSLGQPLRNGSFANARFPDENRVVLRFPGQNADDVSDFIIPPNDRVQLFASGLFHQVCAVFFQGIVSSLRRIAGHPGIAPHRRQHLHKFFLRHVVLPENLLQHTVGRIYHGHENVLHGNIFVGHIFRQFFGSSQRLFQIRRHSRLAAADPGHPLHFIFHRLGQAVHVHFHFLQKLRNEAILLLQQSQQQMLLIQQRVAVFDGAGLGILDGFQRFLCKFLHIHNPFTFLSSSQIYHIHWVLLLTPGLIIHC